MEDWQTSAMLIGITILLVIINGFFVAAEFALVKVRASRLTELVRERKAFARTAQWLFRRMDRSLSACQLGITMASLALGWVGEPAIARLLEPVFHSMGVTSAAVIHALAFIIAFTLITAAHLVIGEQAPKIFAIRRPEPMTLWCALPLKIFYVLSYPLLIALSGATSFLLKFVGIEGASEHDAPHSEEEIRALLSHAHAHGELSRSEHRLLDAVFEFDDVICRQIMVPRVDVEFLDASAPVRDVITAAVAHRHTRYPVCNGSLDEVQGFLHVKDLLGTSDDTELRQLLRPPRFVPETMPVTRLLGHFRAVRQHLAFVIDEHGGVVGIVTLENVLERIVGPVQDEFDSETPAIVPDGAGRYLVDGGIQIEAVNKAIRTELHGDEVDTIGGLLMEQLGRVPTQGDRVEVGDVTIEILETRGSRATRVRLIVTDHEDHADAS